jgi:TolA-binding protein
MRTFRVFILASAVLLMLSSSLPAQGGGDIAKRTLESGLAFYRSGEYRQALQDFMTVINAHPDSEWVDEALLNVARYYYEVEKDLDTARQYLNRIMQEYAGSNSTPEAYYYLGYLLFDARRSVEEMRDGLANLERVVRLFPESQVADNALYLASVIHVALGEYEQALDKLQRLLLEFPESDLRESAQFEIGNCFMFMDNMMQAMIEFQRVRDIYPDSPLADKALRRLTLLYRLHYSEAAGLRPFNVDPAFSIAGYKLDDPTYLVIAPGETLLVADRGMDRVLSIKLGGMEVETIRSGRPDMIKLEPGGRLTVMANRQLSIDNKRLDLITGTGEAAQPLNSIEAFCYGPQGQCYVWDSRQQRIICFKTDLSIEKEYPTGVFKEVRDLAVNSLGHLYVLDGGERQLVKYDPSGKRLLSIGPKIGTNELRDPRYLAVDDANNLYILDRRERSVLVLNPSGEFITALRFGESVKDSRGLAVDSSGGIYIADRRENTVIRFK